MFGARLRPLALRDVLLGGVAAGVTSAVVNSAYFIAYTAATGLRVHEPTIASIALSSLAPSLLGAIGCFLLSRFTQRAVMVFVIATLIVTIASLEGVFRTTLSDGAPKPDGFDGLVMPMHGVVGLTAVLLIPRFARRQPRVRRARR